MVVGLNLLLGLQHGHRPVAEIVVQVGQHTADDAIRFLPGSALLQDGLADAADEKRLEQPFVRLMEQQITMMATVGRQCVLEDQTQHGLGLFDLAEGVGSATQRIQRLAQQAPQRDPWRLLGILTFPTFQ